MCRNAGYSTYMMYKRKNNNNILILYIIYIIPYSLCAFVIVTKYRFLAILHLHRVQLINWGKTNVLLFMLWRMERIVVVHGKKKNVCGGRKENYYTGC